MQTRREAQDTLDRVLHAFESSNSGSTQERAAVAQPAAKQAATTSFADLPEYEILKLKRWRQFQLKREKLAHGEPPPADTEVDAQLARERETGEFDAAEVRAAAEAVREPDSRPPR